MKVRTGFVSNSSSSSFILYKDAFSAEIVNAVRNHYQYAVDHKFDDILKYSGENDAWDIIETDHIIFGSTSMANFSMGDFILKIGIPKDRILYRDHCECDDDEFMPEKGEDKLASMFFVDGIMNAFELPLSDAQKKLLREKWNVMRNDLEEESLIFLKKHPIVIYI